MWAYGERSQGTGLGERFGLLDIRAQGSSAPDSEASPGLSATGRAQQEVQEQEEASGHLLPPSQLFLAQDPLQQQPPED